MTSTPHMAVGPNRLTHEVGTTLSGSVGTRHHPQEALRSPWALGHLLLGFWPPLSALHLLILRFPQTRGTTTWK